MTPKTKADDLLDKVNGKHITKQEWENASEYARKDLVRKANIIIDEVLGVLRYFNEDNAYREDITRTYWNKVKYELTKKGKEL